MGGCFFSFLSGKIDEVAGGGEEGLGYGCGYGWLGGGGLWLSHTRSLRSWG